MNFTVTLSTVAIMLFYTIPGYLLVRRRLVQVSAISSFATILIYVCTPFQTLYAMQQIDYSPYVARYLAISLAVSLSLMAGMLGLVYLIFRSRQSEIPYRISACAAALGNVGFIGLPLLQILIPEYPQMQVFASMFFLSLNVIMWTLGSWVTTRDRRYMNLKKVFLNPASIATAIGLVLLLCRIRLTGQISDMVMLLGRMSTPMCMMVLGMRLAAVPLKSVFTSRMAYVASALKLVALPLLTLAVLSPLPLERDFIRGVFILSCVPVGNHVLSFAEMLGEGQEFAANTVMLSTLLSIITIPFMLLLI